MYFLFEFIVVFFLEFVLSLIFFSIGHWGGKAGRGYKMTSDDMKPYCVPHHTDINLMCVPFEFFSLVINDSEGDIFRL